MSNKFSPSKQFELNIQAIKTIKNIEQNFLDITPNDIQILSDYAGWGGLSDVFPNSRGEFLNEAWKKRNAELKELLTDQEYQQVNASILDAFYTPQKITKAVWSVVKNLGVNYGVVLEPSCGIGNFISACDNANGAFKFVGVEKDSLTARIAGAIHNKNVYIFNMGYEEVSTPSQAVDLVVGNPPYGDFKLRFNQNTAINSYSVHNQFILDSLDKVKSGGYAVYVVSRYVMDSVNNNARLQMSWLADLIGAFRLPSSVFKNEANTEVVTDILVFCKNSDKRKLELENNYYKTSSRANWVDSVGVIPCGDESSVHYNTYFDNTVNVGGELKLKTSQFGYALDVEDNNTLNEKLEAWVNSFGRGCDFLPASSDDISKTQIEFDMLVSHIYINKHKLEIGSIYRNEKDVLCRIVEQTFDNKSFLKVQEVTPYIVWSDRFELDVSGRYYENLPQLNELGEKVYILDDKGVPTTRLVYEKVFFNDDEISPRLRLGETRYDKLCQLHELKVCLKTQVEKESNDYLGMEENRAKLNKIYDAFVKKYSFISSSSNMALVNTMPDGGLLLALEHGYMKEVKEFLGFTATGKNRYKTVSPETAKKSDIFFKRVVFKHAEPETATDAEHALSLSMNYRGRVDIDYMADLLDCENEAVIDALYTDLDKPKIFFNDQLGEWEDHTKYLSGNVSRKLKYVKSHSEDDKKIRALESVQPKRIDIEDINISMGMVWIPCDVYSSFVRSVTDDQSSTVTFNDSVNVFDVKANPTEAKQTIFGTEKMDLTRLLESVLNKVSIRITKTIYDGGVERTVLDQEATEQAIVSATAMKNEFFDWVYQQPDLLERLEQLYNDTFNCYVTPSYNGSELALIGKVPDDVIELRQHQKNAVYRGIHSNSALFDHVVGAGKSYTAIAIMMQRKKLGLTNKGIIVVPNHLVEQFTADVYRLYPSAVVLAARKKDCEKKNRRRLLSKISTGDYDIIIMAHSSFEFLTLSSETEAKFVKEEMDALELGLIRSESEKSEGFSSRSSKAIQKKMKKLEARLEAITKGSRSDRMLTFEELGIDTVILDEAHTMKNLYYTTSMTAVAGLNPPEGSNKALDFYLKTRYLRNNGGAVFLLTGTPISNSAVEMHVMLRYLMLDELKSLNFENFDSWATNFCENTGKFEATESGKLKFVTRFARQWNNLHGLMQLWHQVVDSVTNDDIKQVYFEQHKKHFPIPRVKNGGRQAIVVEPSYEQQEVLDRVLADFENLDTISDYVERNAERLRLMDKARKVSIAARCVNPNLYEDETGGKLQAVADNVYSEYLKWNEDKGTQLIFLDRSIPKTSQDQKIIKEYDSLVEKLEQAKNADDETAIRVYSERLDKFNEAEIDELRLAQNFTWNAYQEIKDSLVRHGIPEREVRFIQEAKTDQQKQDLFDMVISGAVRVLIGSTAKMGAGTNVQNKLVALHHVDIAWLPSSIAQREGRIIRQGNDLLAKYGHDNFEVSIFCYVCERTVDAKLWEVNSNKQKMLSAITNYKGQSSIDFGADADAIGMQEIAALATGNPLMLERVELTAELQSLERLKKTFQRKQTSLSIQLKRAQVIVEHEPKRLASYKVTNDIFADALTVAYEKTKDIFVEINGQKYFNFDDAINEVNQLSFDRQPIKIGNELVKVTFAREHVAYVFEGKKLFSLHADFGSFSRVKDAAQAILPLAQKMSEGDCLDLGLLFGLPLTLECNTSSFRGMRHKVYTMAVYTHDASFALGEMDIENCVTSGILTSALIRCAKGIGTELKDFDSILTSKIKSAQDTVRQVTPLIGGLFSKDVELEYKQFRLSLVEKALTAESPLDEIRQLEELNQDEISFFQSRLRVQIIDEPVVIESVEAEKVIEPVVTESVEAEKVIDEVMKGIQKAVDLTKDGVECIKKSRAKKAKAKTAVISVNGEIKTIEQMQLF